MKKARWFKVFIAVMLLIPSVYVAPIVKTEIVEAATVTNPIVLSGTVSDLDGDVVTVSMTLGGVKKSTTVNTASSSTWNLSWNSSELPQGVYTNVPVLVDDGRGATGSANYGSKIYVDKTAPTAPTITVSGGGAWTQTDKWVDITKGTDTITTVDSLEYNINGGSWTPYTGAFWVSTDNAVVNARNTDSVGNVSAISSVNTKVDKTAPIPPVITLSSLSWTSSNVTAIITGGSDAASGVNRLEYSLDNGTTWSTYSSTITISTTGQTTILARTVDNVGLISSNTSQVAKIDKAVPVAPAISVSVPSNWSATNLTFTVAASAPAPASGVSKVEYRLNGGSWVMYTGVTTISTEGNNLIEGRTTNGVGVVSAIKTAYAKIDKTSPTVPIITGTYPSGTWVSSNNTITITSGTDALSGVQYAGYRVNGAAWDIYSSPFALSSEGSNLIEAFTYDNAGNLSSSVSYYANIDKTAPIAPTIVLSNSSWTSSDITATVSGGSDTTSGLARTEYKIGTGAWTTYTTPLTISTSGQTIIYARTVDNAGNLSGEVSQVAKIDKATPAVPILTLSTTSWTNGNVTFTVANPTTLPTSGVSRLEYRLNGGTWTTYTSTVTVSTERNNTVEARTVSGSGLYSTVVSNNALVDKTVPTAPSISGTYTSDTWSAANSTITVTPGTDALSGVNSTMYRLNGGTWTNYATALTISTEGTTLVEARTHDNAGNISSVTSYTVKLDKTAPTLPTVTSTASTWVNANVTLTATAGTDTASGVARVEYSYNGTTWITYTAPLTESTEGSRNVKFRTVDNVGNTSTVLDKLVQIDKTVPTTPAVTLSSSVLTSSNVTATISTPSTDSLSGIAYSQYRVAGGTWTTYTAPVVISTEGSTTFEVRAYDNVGLVSGIANATARIDKTAPTTPTITLSPDKTWSNSDVTFNISGSTDANTFSYQYKINTGSYTAGSTGVINTNGTHTLTVRAVDAVGNISAEASKTIRVDKDDVNAPTFTTNYSSWTNNNVNITMAYPTLVPVSGFDSMEYKIDSGLWTTYASAISVTTEGSKVISGHAINNAGTVGQVSSIPVYIDKTAPTAPSLSANPATSWSAGNVTVTVTSGTDTGSGVSKTEYQVDGGSWITYTSPIAVTSEGVHTVQARTTDVAGNISSIASLTVRIDKTAPTSPTITKSSASWTTSNVTFTAVSGTDSGSGVARTEWSLNGTDWTTYTAPVVSSTQGQTTYQFRTIDTVGNISTVSSSTSYIDRTAPTEPTFTVSPVSWTNGNVSFSLTTSGTDSMSGFLRNEYRLNGGSWQTLTGSALTFTDEGDNTVEVRSVDNVMNTSTISLKHFYIDKTAPTAPSMSVSPNATWTANNVTVTVKAGTDLGSGVSKTEYQINTGSWTTYTAPVILSAEGVYTVKSRTTDVAGNISDVTSQTVRIDKTAPTNPTVTKSSASWTTSNVTLTVTHGTDSGSGVANTFWSLDGSTWNIYTTPIVVSTEGETTYQFRTVDTVGNVSGITNPTTYIDRTSPTEPTYTLSPTSWTNGNVTMTLTTSGTDSYSGFLRNEYRINSGAWQTLSGTTLTLTQEGDNIIELRTLDNMLNASTSTVKHFYIDKTAPTQPTITFNDDSAWVANDLTFTVSGSTDPRGVSYEYKINSGSFTAGNTSTITATGTYTITARAIDSVGNISETVSRTVSIDKQNPAPPTVVSSSLSWTNTAVTVTPSHSTDVPFSGFTNIQYRIGTGTWTNLVPSAVLVEDEGVTTVSFRVVSGSGRYSSITAATVRIDKTAPTEASAVLNPSAEWAKTDVNVTLSSGTDEASGVDSVWYNLGSGWFTYASTMMISAEGVTTISIRTRDVAGNFSAITTQDVKIDKTAPAVPTITTSSLNWTDGDVTLEATAGTDALSGSAGVEYSFNGTTWQTYSDPVVVDTEGQKTFYARTFDVAGNRSAVESIPVKIDRTGPTAPISEVNPSTWVSGSVNLTVSVNGSDPLSGFDHNEYKLPDGDWQRLNTTATITTEGNTLISVRSVDKVGNTGDIATINSYIDTVAPTTPTITATHPTTVWATGDSTVSINDGSDSTSGLDYSEYRVNNGSWIQYTSPLVITADGSTIIEARSVDNASNKGNISSYDVRLDNTAPTVPTVTLSNNDWSAEDVTIEAVPGTDVHSGVAGVEWSYTGLSWTDYTGELTETLEGARTLMFRTVDNVGNVSTAVSVEVKIDKSGPTAPVVDVNPNGLTKQDVFVSVSADGTDSLSGFDHNEYRIGNGNWSPIGAGITISDEGITSIDVRSVDYVGNKSPITTVSTNIDKTVPTIPTITLSNVGWSTADVSFVIDGSTDVNTMAYQYSIDGAPFVNGDSGVVSVNGTHTVKARTVDAADNTSAEASATIRIDKDDVTAPDFTTSSVGWTNQDVLVSFLYPAMIPISGFKNIESNIDGGAWELYTSALEINTEGTKLVNGRTINNASAASATTTVPVYVDRTPPSIPSISLTNSDWTNEDVEVSVTSGTDMDSGVDKTEYRINSGVWKTYVSTITLSLQEQYFIEARTLDVAGNYSTIVSDYVYIDKTAPTAPEVTRSNNDWSPVAVIVSAVSGTDDFSDVSHVEYSLDAGATWNMYSTPQVVSEEGVSTLQYRTVDKAGNTSPVTETKTYVDYTAPTSTDFDLTPATWVSGAVTLQVTTEGVDSLSGFDYNEYRVNNGPWETLINNTAQLTDEGENTVEVRPVDKVGNIGVETLKTFYIDTTSPTVPTITTDVTNLWTAEDVTFTLSGSTDAHDFHYEYKINDGDYMTGNTATLSATGVYTITARAIDFVGNISDTSSIVVNLDKELPTSPVSSTSSASWTNQPVTFSFDYPTTEPFSGFDHIEYRIDTGVWETYSSDVVISAEGTTRVQARTVSKSGQKSSPVTDFAYIDLTNPQPPVVTTDAKTMWVNHLVKVSLVAVDDEASGVAKMQYRVSSGPWKDYTEPVEISTEGVTLVESRTIDIAGNISDIESINVFIDKTKPNAPTVSSTHDDWTTSDVTVNAVAEGDDASGVDRLEWSYDETNWGEYTTPVTEMLEGSRSLYFRVVDSAGNVSDSSSKLVRIDRTGPTAPQLSVDPAIWSQGPAVVTVEVNGVDALSGHGHNEYRIADGSWQLLTDSATIDLEGETEIQVRSVDAIGNNGAPVVVTTLIDTIAPIQPAVSLSNNDYWARTAVEFTLSASTDLHDFDYQYSIDGQPYVKSSSGELTTDGVYELSAQAVDFVGNVSSTTTIPVRVDKTAPVIVLNPNQQDWKAGEIVVSPEISDATSGVASKFYAITNSVDEPAEWKDLTGEIKIIGEGIWYVHLKATDVAGNTTTYTSSEFKSQKSPSSEKSISFTNVTPEGFLASWELPSSESATDGYTYTISIVETGEVHTVDYPISSVSFGSLVAGKEYTVKLVISNNVGSTEVQKTVQTLPASPSNLRVDKDGTNPTDAYLYITPIFGSTGYHVRVTSTSGVQIADTTVVDTTVKLTGLTAGQQYNVTVSAVNSFGEGEGKTVVWMALPSTASGFTSANIFTNKISLRWEDVDSADKYNLYRGDDLIISDKRLSYDDEGLTSGHSYSYKLNAENVSGVGEFSELNDLITLTSSPSKLMVNNVTSSSADISWSSVTGADSYRVTDSAGNDTLVSGTTLHLADLAAGTDYTVTVAGINASGEGDSLSQSFVTIPDVITSVSVTNQQVDSMTLSWPAVPGATYYVVEMDGQVITTPDPTVTIKDLPAGKSSVYKVHAGNTSGEGKVYSGSAWTKPSFTNNIKVVNSTETSVIYAWDAVTGANSYVVTLPDGKTIKVTDPTYSLTGLVGGTKYTVSIQAQNDVGLGSGTSFVWSTLPLAPSGVTTQVGVRNADLSWEPTQGSVDYFVGDEDGAVLWAGTETNAQFTGLSSGSTKVYKIWSRDEYDQLSGKQEIAIMTKPAAPTLVGSISSERSVISEFSFNQDIVGGFRVYRDGLLLGTGFPVIPAYTDTAIKTNSVYQYTVVPFNLSGDGEPLNYTVTTPPAEFGVDDVTVAVGDTNATLTFPETAGNNGSYTVYDGSKALVVSQSSPLIVSGLTPGTVYDFSLVAVNEQKVESSPFNLSLLTKPAAPSNISTEIGQTTVKLDLSQDITFGVDEYIIYRDGKEIGRVKVGGEFVDGNLKAGTQYVYTVSSSNASGESVHKLSLPLETVAAPKPEPTSTPTAEPTSTPTTQPTIKPTMAPNTSSAPISTIEVVITPSPTPIVSPSPTPTTPPVITATPLPIPVSTGEPMFSDVTTSFARGAIENLAEQGIIRGIRAKIFEPDRPINRVEFAALIVRAVATNLDESIRLTFSDVSDSAWYGPELKTAISTGVAIGYSKTEFRPYEIINREQGAKMMINVAQNKQVSINGEEVPFTDSSSVAGWASSDVSAAVELGLMEGYPDGSFKPKQGLTRAESAVLIYRLLNQIR